MKKQSRSFSKKWGGGIFVFDKVAFQKYVTHEQFLPGSYTVFENKIGISQDQAFLTRTGEIVLDFPYKDSVFHGIQSHEDAGHDEILVNTTIHQRDVDRLFHPKVFTNWRMYEGGTEDEIAALPRDMDGMVASNLIVKGNNLVALHSLVKVYRQKVKMIYIDPPYNTGGPANAFGYNNNYSRSTWYTFMHNRLKVARDFLRDDGFIAIAIDHYELGYLIVLADEIFGRENRIGIITVVNNPALRNQVKFFSPTNDFMIVYARDKDVCSMNNVILHGESLAEFNEEDEEGKFKWVEFMRTGGGPLGLRENKSENFWYPLYVSGDLQTVSTEPLLDPSSTPVYPISPTGKERTWDVTKDSAQELVQELSAKFHEKRGCVVIYKKYRVSKGEKVPTVWWKKKYNSKEHGTKLLSKILGRKNSGFNYPKSVFTLEDIIRTLTEPTDIVLDFFAGSGTTGHAVLNLNWKYGESRRFIMIEQMDYIEDVTLARINSVIADDMFTTWPSEVQGATEVAKPTESGSNDRLIYMELASLKQIDLERIRNATKKELLDLWIGFQSDPFISYRVEFDKTSDEEFARLPVHSQKKILQKIIDLNMLYIPYSEINDDSFKVSDIDRHLNKDFYGNG
ncbi:MAG: site-specific DNA-methyltransferase [Bacteroidetes bacterium]|nr:site-specific DNA-methyltransferase [Bacteroidota bacterium]